MSNIIDINKHKKKLEKKLKPKNKTWMEEVTEKRALDRQAENREVIKSWGLKKKRREKRKPLY